MTTGAGSPDATEAHRQAFIQAHAAVGQPPLVPEVRLWLASDVTALWLATEADLERQGVPPPYWAFCWAGGQAVARYVLDHPETVRGLRVLDFAAGGGVAAIAAARAGAQSVEACEIDPYATSAMALNVALNDVSVSLLAQDVVGAMDRAWDVVLAGDVCYERPMADRVIPWLRALAGRGTRVLLGDPGRAYLPAQGLSTLACYDVAVSRDLEDRDVRATTVHALLP
ncbi:class I SAM-dependent methyltransferase [Pararhodospirillum oryzae]|uniref:Nicotinamide N-methylase n=1 Tax=Pararhodospirillum oryzae TaxID=478448 RepID=A0A512H768_9PROT|nr:50S ribosomal protein L11 methyltransferase [Pararhodospirillum oryzae]GEO81303.1 nicotinamide N-methylase [Pararhodospirillum oryzae]